MKTRAGTNSQRTFYRLGLEQKRAVRAREGAPNVDSKSTAGR